MHKIHKLIILILFSKVQILGCYSGLVDSAAQFVGWKRRAVERWVVGQLG